MPEVAHLTADQAAFLRDWMLPALRNEHHTTARVMQAIPRTGGDYRPDGVCKSALELAWHIVAAEKRFMEGIIGGALDFSPFHRPEGLNDGAEIAAWFDENFAMSIGKLEALSGEQLAKTLDFRGMLRLPAVSFLQLSMNHSIHHRGQLSTYLRPMGGKVPSIYGESYDTAQARLAKQGDAN